jgi:3-dehydroquinate synthetase
MAAAVVVSLNLKLIKPSDARRILSLIAKCGLPLDVKSIKLTKIREALSHDKKFIHGINRFILPAAIGKVRIVEEVPERIVKDAILAHLK